MSSIIEIENLGKEYRLSTSQRYLALRDVLSGLTKKKQKKYQETIWALKDVNLNVKAGEKIGIIGANGAGKSSLLKIISRIVPPSTGSVTIRGRVGSLLEVGTGFHPELSGVENIYLNGSILGLKKKEITEKLGAIIEFSGVEKFIDTPLKYYSSGMQLRLAFSVAAHLEPEILLIDEVLAVGDLEFQRKCMGKMEEINKTQGRTILFVSHNLAAVSNLCSRVILLEKGRIKNIGTPEEIISEYIHAYQKTQAAKYIANDLKNAKTVFISSAEMKKANGRALENFDMSEDVFIDMLITKNSSDANFMVGVAVNDINEKRIVIDQYNIECPTATGSIRCRIKIPSALLTPNDYSVDLALIKQGSETLDIEKNILRFSITKTNTKYEYLNYDYGYINRTFDWEVETVDDAGKSKSME